jgi:hypothetical protein
MNINNENVNNYALKIYVIQYSSLIISKKIFKQKFKF